MHAFKPAFGLTKTLGQLAVAAGLFCVSLQAQIAFPNDTDYFVDHFHDEAAIPEYVKEVDELIDAGEHKTYSSMEAEAEDSRTPRTKTPNGILMLYTVTHTKEGVVIHFSTSRAPYLPIPLGKHMVGLFMARSGWPKPSMFSISEHQVFHAVWLIPEAQFAQIQASLPELRAKIRKSENAKTAFLRALIRSAELEKETDQVPSPRPDSGAPARVPQH